MSNHDDIIQFPRPSAREPRPVAASYEDATYAAAAFDCGSDNELARDTAAGGVCDILRNFARWRTRDYVMHAEYRQSWWFAAQPQERQQAVLHAALLALTAWLPQSGVSVRPGDLYSGFHLADVLQLLTQYPRLWRQIALEGIRSGALLFEQQDDNAVVLFNMGWLGDFTAPPPEEEVADAIFRCAMVMNEAYPEILPDPSWAADPKGTSP